METPLIPAPRILFPLLLFLGLFGHASVSDAEAVLLGGGIPTDGLEDVVAWLRLDRMASASGKEGSNGARMLAEAASDFSRRFPASPYAARVGQLALIQSFESAPAERFLESRMPRGDALVFYAWLKKRGRFGDAACFLERQVFQGDRPTEWSSSIADLAACFRKAGTNLVSRARAETNEGRRDAWGRVFYRAEHWADAVEIFETVAPTNRLTGNTAPSALEEAHYYLGVCESRRLHPEKADGHYRRFLACWPDAVADRDNPRAWARQFFIENLERLSRWDEAWAEATNAYAKTGEERYLRIAARMAKALGRPDYPEWRGRYLGQFPGSWSAYILSRDDAISALVAGRREEGLSILSKAYRARPQEWRMLVSILSNTNARALFLSNENLFFDALYFSERDADSFPFPWGERTNFLGMEREKAAQWDLSGGETNLFRPGRFYLADREGLKWRALCARAHPFRSWSNASAAFPPAVSPALARRVKWLVALGEASFAEQALRKAPFPGELERDLALRAFWGLTGEEDRAVKSALASIDSRRDEWNLFPWEILRQGFPRWHEETVGWFCRMYRVPLHLAWAVMREESHFTPDAVSSAGALGLMQIMDSTGRGLYAGAALTRLQKYDLRDPVLNMHLGIRYLGHLLRFFGGDEIKAVAGYNGGEYNVARWARNNGPFAGRLHFTLMIPYDETERYVQKVIRSRFLYDVLYGSE